MDIPKSCENCVDRRVAAVERAVTRGSGVALCPLMALIALKAEHVTPPIEQHFLHLAESCGEETHGNGGLYTVQHVQGERAVAALVTIKDTLSADEVVEVAA